MTDADKPKREQDASLDWFERLMADKPGQNAAPQEPLTQQEPSGHTDPAECRGMPPAGAAPEAATDAGDLVTMLDAASRDDRLADGMLYRKAAATIAALRREVEELGPQVCCENWDDCDQRCVPLARTWKERAESVERELAACREDSKRLNWYENAHTLHDSVECLYVVDGYDIAIIHNDNEVSRHHGNTVREAIDAAIKAARKV